MDQMSTVQLNLYARSLQFRTEIRVVLPEYPKQRNDGIPHKQAFDAATRFPVVYLLHGFTGDYTDWTNMIPIERFAAETGFAIVMPHGYNTWYMNIPGGPQMETFIAEELPAAMEALLPISDRPQDRFIAGLSMGGTGAIRMAWRYPQRYCAAAAMSALPDLTQPFCEKDNPAYENHLRQSVQFAYGSDRRKPHDDRTLLELGAAQQQAGINLPPLLFHYGEQDVRYQVQYMPFKRFCEAHQLPVTFATAPGGHGFGYWEPTVRQILHWFKDLHQQGCHRDAYSKKQAVQ